MHIHYEEVEILANEFKDKYQVVGLVETHVLQARDPDLHARAIAQGFVSSSNPAMKYVDSEGNHGGEMILAAKHTYSMPIDSTILDNARMSNDEPSRFSALEVRHGKMSILVVVAYFWCSEGLSPRNWAILHQLSMLVRQF